MPWQVLVLEEFEEDVAFLTRHHGLTPGALLDDATAAFTDPYKAARLDKLLSAGAATAALDRLAGSAYPPSVRLQVLHDLRATAWLFPRRRHALLVHAFHKSADPRYRRALATHDGRLKQYFEGFHEFVERKRRG